MVERLSFGWELIFKKTVLEIHNKITTRQDTQNIQNNKDYQYLMTVPRPSAPQLGKLIFFRNVSKTMRIYRSLC